MAKKLIPSVQEQNNPQGFPAVLSSAVYEWFLIFLLFVHALLSYLVTKFAHFCKLQPPCILCSRLDHVVGNEDPGFYKSYLCNAHKLEISSLVFCPIHDKLADVHGMCEGCLFSFATEKKSNSEAYKILVGKLGSELFRSHDQDSLVKNSLCESHCSCCNDTWTSRSYFHKLLQTKSLGAKVAEGEAPSPGSAGLRRVRDNLKKRSRKQSGQKEWSYLRSRSFDPLSHVGYSELKITSESESEVPFSDEDDASDPDHEANGIKEEFVAKSVQLEAQTPDPLTVFKTPRDLAQEELIYQASILGPSRLISNEQIDVGVPHGGQSSTSTVAIPSVSCLVSDDQLDVSVPHDVQSSKSDVAIPRSSFLVSDEKLNVGVPQNMQPSTSSVAIPRPSLFVSDDQLHVSVAHDVQSSTASAAIPRTSLLVSDAQLDVSVPRDVQSSTSTVPIAHGLEELKWHQAEQQTELTAPPPECISLKDIPAPSDFISLKDTHLPSETAEVSEKTLDTIGAGDMDQLSATDAGEVVAKLENDLVMPTEPCLKRSQVVEVSDGTCAVDVVVTPDNEHTSVTERVELHKLENGETHNLECGLSTASDPCSKTEQVSNDAGPPVSNLAGLTDVFKLAVGNKSQVSSMLAEHLIGENSTRVTEDLKMLLSQVSAARGVELSSNEMSPRMHVHGEESKDSDSSSSMRLQFLPKKISTERNESGSESLDGSIVGEIEGESVVDRLKRQVEYDVKSMSALYKELEEERNASAVAANQAMAMITRLQEEKASLQMETLQYLRMMEEQAEYDVDELQKANDLLADKEKEMQDLEAELADKEKELQDLVAELEIYRIKFSNESMDENIQEACCDLNGEDMEVEHPDESSIHLKPKISCVSLVSKECEGSNTYEKNDIVNGDACMSDVKDSLLDFEDERIYISECLKKWEKQLRLVSTNGVQGDNSVKESHVMNDLEQPHCTEENHGNGQLQEDEASVQNDSPINGLSTHESCNPSVGNFQFVTKENHQCSDSDGGTPLAVIGNEFSDLNERLDAIEADRTFLEHAINALHSGDEGVKFLKEIAQNLRELRRFGIRRGDQTIA